MLILNGYEIKQGHFPDNTTNICVPVEYILKGSVYNTILWKFENNEELLLLQFLVAHLRDNEANHIKLQMPYVPYARQDKALRSDNILMLKYFASIINGLNFSEVIVLDPHSTVTQNLFNRLKILTPVKMIEKVYGTIAKEEKQAPLIFFPDAGSVKRYENTCKQNYCFGVKTRNAVTGAIENLDICGNVESITGRSILIIDDICSAGGTFLHSATALKERGATNIYLWATHCEDNIHNGKLLEDSCVKRIYTTNSLTRRPHIKIEEFNLAQWS